MKKNVVIITGSPRRGGNTDLMAEAFARGAREAGHEVALFNAAADPVLPCTACDACWSNGKACVFEDGFTRLAPLLQNADAIVWCGPIYWFSFKTQLKAAIDKIYAFSGNAPHKLKGSAYLLMCAGDGSEEIFSFAKQEFDAIFSFLELRLAGYLFAPGAYEKGDVKNSNVLARAEQMGREIA